MNMLAAITWNGSPEILSIGPIHLRWYGLLFALSFIVGYQIITKIFTSEGKSQKDVESLTIWMIIGTVVGARLGHCFFYEPSYYLSNPLEILKVWNGGLASHGAALGILLSIYYYSKGRRNISMLWTLDRVVIVVALAGFLIRLGNFFNSEILGLPSAMPWAIVFERIDQIPRHPAMLYESISYLFIFFYLMFVYTRKGAATPEGKIFGLFLILVFVARFIIEFVKEDQTVFEAGMMFNMGQILSVPFILAGIYFLMRLRKKS